MRTKKGPTLRMMSDPTFRLLQSPRVHLGSFDHRVPVRRTPESPTSSPFFFVASWPCLRNKQKTGASSTLTSNSHCANDRGVTHPPRKNSRKAQRHRGPEKSETSNKTLCSSPAGAGPSSHSSFSQDSKHARTKLLCHLWN